MVFYVIAAVASIGLFPMPYVGYTLVRIGVSGACLYGLMSVKGADEPAIGDIKARYFLGAIGILYNPLIPIWLTREVWIVVDLCVMVICALLIRANGSSDQHPKASNSAELLSSKATDYLSGLREVSDTTGKKADRFMSRLLWLSLGLLAYIVIITFALD